MAMKISDLYDDRIHDVYCVNTAIKVMKRATVVLLSVMSRDGREMAVEIADTWIPIQLTAQASKDSLLNSESFRRAINRGLIELIPVDQAEEILEGEDAKEEIAALNAPKVIEDIDAEESAPVRLRDLASPAVVSALELTDPGAAYRKLFRLKTIMTDHDVAYVKATSTDAKILNLLS